MGHLRNLDEKYQEHVLWQLLKFNVVGISIGFFHLILANLMPFLFDRLTTPLPPFLQGVFPANILFPEGGKYVVDGAVTWGYVLPFLLGNLIANTVDYYINMKATFKGKGTKAGLAAYFVIMVVLMLVSTWMQGLIVSALSDTSWAGLSRTIAVIAAGAFQMGVLFPLEKYVLFK